MKNTHGDLLNDIKKTGKLTKEQDDRIGKILEEWIPQSGITMK